MGETNSATAKPRIFGLDLMRFVAVAFVVFGHFLDHAKTFSPAVYNLKRVGIFGVEIFFVLSGYLIGGIVIKEIKSKRFNSLKDLGRFWGRRWMRTLPLYYLFFVIYLYLDWPGPNSFLDRLPYLVFLQNFAWRIPNFYIISWSLAVEEYFYLLFPAFLWLALKRFSAVKALALSICVFILVPLTLRALTAPYPDWEGFDFLLRMIIVKRLDAPMYGVAAVFTKEFFPDVWRTIKRWTPLWVIVLIAACVHIYIFDNRNLWVPPWNGLEQTVYFSVMAVMVALLLPYCSAWLSRKSVVASTITYISTISYSIYLVHPLVIVQVRNFVDRVPGRLARMDDQFITLALIQLPLIALLASLSYFAWERPFMRLRDRWI